MLFMHAERALKMFTHAQLLQKLLSITSKKLRQLSELKKILPMLSWRSKNVYPCWLEQTSKSWFTTKNFEFDILVQVEKSHTWVPIRVQWFLLFFTFWGITTHPWHPKGPRIWKLAKKFFQLHPWPAEIFRSLSQKL